MMLELFNLVKDVPNFKVVKNEDATPMFFLEKGKHKNKNGVLGESLAAINGQQGEDCGKRNALIPKNAKVKFDPWLMWIFSLTAPRSPFILRSP